MAVLPFITVFEFFANRNKHITAYPCSFKFFNHIMKEVEVSQEFHYFDYTDLSYPFTKTSLLNVMFVFYEIFLSKVCRSYEKFLTKL